MPTEIGVKLDQDKNDLSLIFKGFANALWEVGLVGTFGAKKYTKDGWEKVPDNLHRYTSALERHLLQETIEGPIDNESGLHHAAHAAWNSLARLELILRKENG